MKEEDCWKRIIAVIAFFGTILCSFYCNISVQSNITCLISWTTSIAWWGEICHITPCQEVFTSKSFERTKMSTVRVLSVVGRSGTLFLSSRSCSRNLQVILSLSKRGIIYTYCNSYIILVLCKFFKGRTLSPFWSKMHCSACCCHKFPIMFVL